LEKRHISVSRYWQQPEEFVRAALQRRRWRHL
jgi:hypothetical protein